MLKRILINIMKEYQLNCYLSDWQCSCFYQQLHQYQFDLVMFKLIINKSSFSSTKYFVILRHGQSEWNQDKRWAGWTDIKLSPKGIQQSIQCAKIIRNYKIEFDEVYTSVLSRTIITANYILDELNMGYIPIIKSWRLNQKNYGALQGESKYAVTIKYGQDKVNQWRRSIDIRPPSLNLTDYRHPIHDRRYKYLAKQELPSSECLIDICLRLKPLLEEIKDKLKIGKKILIITHGNVIRSLFYIMFKMSQEQLTKLNFPNAVPIIMNFNQDMIGVNYSVLGDKRQIEWKMKQIENETKIMKQN